MKKLKPGDIVHIQQGNNWYRTGESPFPIKVKVIEVDDGGKSFVGRSFITGIVWSYRTNEVLKIEDFKPRKIPTKTIGERVIQ